MSQIKVPENRAYKVTLIVLVGLAAFSTAMKDLNRLQEMVSSVKEFTGQWHGTDLVMLNVESISPSESCPNDSPQLINPSSESGSSEGIAPARDNEIEMMDYETITEPEVGGKVELVASRKVNRNVPRLAGAKYAQGRNLEGEISAMRRAGHGPTRFEYKTFDRTVTVELPITMLTDIKADAFEAEVSPDFSLSLLGKIGRKQSHGRTDSARREFMLKRFERNIASRRAG